MPGQHAPSHLMGWQLLAGIPKSSSQLQRIKSSLTSTEIFYPTGGQHQTTTCTTEHHQARASQRRSDKHPCVFSDMSLMFSNDLDLLS